MKSVLVKDKKIRYKFYKSECTQKFLKSFQKNSVLSNFQTWWVMFQPKLNNFTSKVKIKNRCLLTGRGSSISRCYKFSRITFRLFAREGLICGLKKSSW
jgi:small subunit ribosomal protein S14